MSSENVQVEKFGMHNEHLYALDRVMNELQRKEEELKLKEQARNI